MYFRDFVAALQELGVRNAIYLDMGSWSDSWYRDNTGKANTLIGMRWSLFHYNWLVFRK